MRHEKMVTNSKGDRVMITTVFWMAGVSPVYKLEISVCKKGKSKFLYNNFGNDFQYRKLNNRERYEFEINEALKYVTKEQLESCALELWKLLKPVDLFKLLNLNP